MGKQPCVPCLRSDIDRSRTSYATYPSALRPDSGHVLVGSEKFAIILILLALDHLPDPSAGTRWSAECSLRKLNQLPYLDSKHEYLWGGKRAAEVAERDVPVLRADKSHTTCRRVIL
jgi:hypothetical protein